MKLQRRLLGEFIQSSPKMTVSDPCYDKDTSVEIRGELEGVAEGTWNAYTLRGEIGSWGERVCELQVFHSSTSPEVGDSSVWMKCAGFEVGVDSGQAGFYDTSKYPIGDVGDFGDGSSFYGQACELTSDRSTRGGIIQGFGAVSNSGVGDGCYECYTLYDDNDVIVGAKIIFIDTDEENELTEGSECEE